MDLNTPGLFVQGKELHIRLAWTSQWLKCCWGHLWNALILVMCPRRQFTVSSIYQVLPLRLRSCFHLAASFLLTWAD